MSRARHEWRVYHPAEQRAILKRLRGEPETAEERRIVDALAAELEERIAGRKRQRRLPSERAARKSQIPLFYRLKNRKAKKSSL